MRSLLVLGSFDSARAVMAMVPFANGGGGKQQGERRDGELLRGDILPMQFASNVL